MENCINFDFNLFYFFFVFYYQKNNRKQVSVSQSEAEKDKVRVPTTVEEYCIKQNPKSEEQDFTEFYDDYDCDDYDCDDEDNFLDDSGQSDQEQSEVNEAIKTSSNATKETKNNVTNSQPDCIDKSKQHQQIQQEDSGNEEL